MRLPLRLEYACQVLAQLARDYEGGGLRQVDELAGAEGLSANYSMQILTSLRQAGLVESQRGRHGGYRLARKPEEITLAEISAAMGESPLLESSRGNGGMSAAAVRSAWQRVNETVLSSCEAIRLSEMMPGPDPGGDWVI